MRSAVLTPLIITVCLLSYANTNYCFLSLCDRKVGDAFLSRLTSSIIHTQHSQTIWVLLLCHSLWLFSHACLLWASGLYLQTILWWSITDANKRGIFHPQNQHCSCVLCKLSFPSADHPATEEPGKSIKCTPAKNKGTQYDWNYILS